MWLFSCARWRRAACINLRMDASEGWMQQVQYSLHARGSFFFFCWKFCFLWLLVGFAVAVVALVGVLIVVVGFCLRYFKFSVVIVIVVVVVVAVAVGVGVGVGVVVVVVVVVLFLIEGHSIFSSSCVMFFFFCGAAGCYTGPRHRRSQQSSPQGRLSRVRRRSGGPSAWTLAVSHGRGSPRLPRYFVWPFAMGYILLDGFFFG